MKKTLFLILFALTTHMASVAQNIALGERVPEVKAQTWLAGRQPAAAEMTYVAFFHSENKACITSLEQLKALTNKFGTKLRVIVVAQEKEAKITPILSPYLSTQIFVALDAEGRVFAAYGVSYVPFGVLTDAKNRALWMGNSLQLTEKVIENSK